MMLIWVINVMCKPLLFYVLGFLCVDNLTKKNSVSNYNIYIYKKNDKKSNNYILKKF